jgi:hypothetical protein
MMVEIENNESSSSAFYSICLDAPPLSRPVNAADPFEKA